MFTFFNLLENVPSIYFSKTCQKLILNFWFILAFLELQAEDLSFI